MKLAKVRQLYHLSTENHDGETFVPRVPEFRAFDEDGIVKRICFSTTLTGAYRAIYEHYYGNALKLYVHVPVVIPEAIYAPDETEVYDVGYTHEKWVCENTKMKCIGLAMFRGYNLIDDTEIPKNVSIKWINIRNYPF